MTNVEKAIKKIKRDLESHGVKFEVMGKSLIDTDNCTINVYKDHIEVNERPVELNDVIWEVLAIERPDLK